MSEPLDATKSLCWTCKWGLCVKQEEVADLHHVGEMDFEQGGLPGIDALLSEENHHGHGGGMHQHISATKICCICHYTPPGRNDIQPTIQISRISQCNRYEKDDTITGKG